jgi:hypothetical protein
MSGHGSGPGYRSGCHRHRVVGEDVTTGRIPGFAVAGREPVTRVARVIR